MSASLVERFWVARVKRQGAAREVAHPQAATLEMPGYSFTEGVNESVQRRRLTRLGPSQAPARVWVEVNPVQLKRAASSVQADDCLDHVPNGRLTICG